MSRKPGWESPAKGAARQALYHRIQKLFEAGGVPEGWIVTLAGHDAAEIPLIRDRLKWDPARVLFVDKKRAGLQAVRREWPEARTYRGDLLRSLRLIHVDQIAFANLDFTGTANQHRADCVALVGTRLANRGMVSYTFSRGRENDRAKLYWRDVYNPVRHIAHRTQDDIRFRGYAEWIGRLLNKGAMLEVAMAMKYQSSLTMGSLLFQYMPHGLRTLDWNLEMGSLINDGVLRTASMSLN